MFYFWHANSLFCVGFAFDIYIRRTRLYMSVMKMIVARGRWLRLVNSSERESEGTLELT